MLSSKSAPPRILVIGDFAAPEMRPALVPLADLPPDCVTGFPGLAELFEQLPDSSQVDGVTADLILVFQAWSDQFSPQEVLRLLAAFPLSRLVCCYGAWCAADARSRVIWPAASRVSAPLAAGRIDRELAALTNGWGAILRPLPLTASREEVFLHDHPRGDPPLRRPLRVHVETPDRAYGEFLQAALNHWGCGAVGGCDDARVYGVLWDADPWEERFADLARVRQRFRGARLVALAGMPHADFTAELRSAGADDVLPKLAPLEMLARSLGPAAAH